MLVCLQNLSLTFSPCSLTTVSILIICISLSLRSRTSSMSFPAQICLINNIHQLRSTSHPSCQHSSHQCPAGGDIQMSPQDSSLFYFHPPSDSNSSSVSYYQHHSSRWIISLLANALSNSDPYEDGSESRPQSRRFTIMEFCNNDEQQFRERRERERERERGRCSSISWFSTP